MIPEAETRQLLIDSCHSSTEAEERILRELQSREFVSLLVDIAVDAADYQGDAPMQAAYFLSKAPPSLVQPHETALLALLESADGYAGSVALMLGRMKSQQAKAVIEQRLAEGWWPEHLYKEAMSCYEQA
jgi:hypothetical protein